MRVHKIAGVVVSAAIALLAGCASNPAAPAAAPAEADAQGPPPRDAAPRPRAQDAATAVDSDTPDRPGIDAAPALADAAPVTTPGDAAATPEAGGVDAASGTPSVAWDHPVEGRPTWRGPTVMGTVSVDRATKAGRVGPGFLGLSFEKSHMTDAFFTTANAPLVGLFRLLGPCVLRIGANDVDRTTWDPAATPMPGTFSRTVGTQAVDALAAFMRATGWRVIYGVNLKTGTPASSAAEAKYAAGKLGASLYGFELGNEINLGGVPYAERKPQWESLAAAVRALVPDAPLIGPASNPSGLSGFLIPFVKDEAPKLRLVTHHYYRGSGTSPTSTMDKLLSADPNLVKTLQTIRAAAADAHVPDGFRLGETASFSSHGAAGVSDAFGAALWALDFFFDNAANGSSGINFHGGGQGEDGNRPFYYAPIAEEKSVVTGARPIFYGMLAMALLGQGDVLGTTAAAGALAFSAHALGRADGTLMLVLLNKDAANGVDARVDVGASASDAAVVYLQAAALGATSGVTLAGAGISAAGAWSPGPPFKVEAGSGTVTVSVPPSSAALLRIR